MLDLVVEVFELSDGLRILEIVDEMLDRDLVVSDLLREEQKRPVIVDHAMRLEDLHRDAVV